MSSWHLVQLPAVVSKHSAHVLWQAAVQPVANAIESGLLDPPVPAAAAPAAMPLPAAQRVHVPVVALLAAS